MVATGIEQAAPARRMAVGGAVVALAMEWRMERSMGLSAETLHVGKAKRLMDLSRALTIGGAVVRPVFGGRNRGAPRSQALRSSPVRCAPDSPSSKPARHRPATRAIPWFRNASRRLERRAR